MDLYQISEIELHYKNRCKASERPQVFKAEEAYKIFLNHWDENKLDFIEQAKVMLLSRANRVLGICNVSSGGTVGTVIDTRLVFVTAIKANATSIILAHNHPSANQLPSNADKVITKQITEAGKYLGVDLRDHIIVTSEGFYSFAEELAYQKTERMGTTYYEALPPF
jgi:DNA repair protein RadC